MAASQGQRLPDGDLELKQAEEARDKAEEEYWRLYDEVTELEQRVASAEQDEERKPLEKELTIKRVKRDLADAKHAKAYFLYEQRKSEKERADLLVVGGDVTSQDDYIRQYKERMVECEEKIREHQGRLLEMEQEEEYQRLLDEALKVGYIECELFVAILVGPAGVGKTCLLHLLLGKKPPSSRTSTGVAESPVTIQIREVSGSKIEVFFDGKWEAVTSENMLPKIARFITRGFATSDAGKRNPLPKDVEECLEQLASSLSTDPSDTSTSPVSSAATPCPKPHQHRGMTSTAIKEVIESVMGEVLELMSSENLSEGGKREIFSAAWVYITDCGGQPQFHELLPLFIHGISAAVFVLRLSDRLDGYPADEYYKDGKLVGSALCTQLTTEDQIKCLIRSLLSRSTKLELPKIIIVGTHLDQVKKCSEGLDAKNEKLLKMLGPEFRDQLVFYQHNKLIHPVNTQSPGEHGEAVATSVRRAIERSAAKKVKIPIWWHMLEVLLRKLAAKLGRKVLSRSVCLEIARRLNFTEKAFNAAMKFFNELNIIKYSEAIPGIVFIDSQVPLDKISEVVQRCYRLLYGEGPFPFFDKKWRRFCEEGVVTLELLEEFTSHYVEGLFECKDFVELLKHQLAIVPLATVEPTASTAEQCNVAEYFFPALLKILQRTELEKQRVFSCAASPLLFRFSHGCRRSGVFCCLVVHLMKHCNWCIQHENGDLILVARNCITFRPYRNECYVTLIDAFFYIEVHVNAPPPMCIEHCPKIRQEVNNGIVAACKVLKYDNDHPHLAFFCPHSGSVEVESENDRHAATILEKGGYCSCTQRAHFFKLEDKHDIWLKEQDTPKCVAAMEQVETVSSSAEAQGDPQISHTLPSDSADTAFALKKPEYYEMDMIKHQGKVVKVIDGTAHKWERFATRLHFGFSDIKRIEKECRLQPVEACQQVVGEWLSGKGRKPTSWSTIIEALDEIELSELAKDLTSVLEAGGR